MHLNDPGLLVGDERSSWVGETARRRSSPATFLVRPELLKSEEGLIPSQMPVAPLALRRQQLRNTDLHGNAPGRAICRGKMMRPDLALVDMAVSDRPARLLELLRAGGAPSESRSAFHLLAFRCDSRHASVQVKLCQWNDPLRMQDLCTATNDTSTDAKQARLYIQCAHDYDNTSACLIVYHLSSI